MEVPPNCSNIFLTYADSCHFVWHCLKTFLTTNITFTVCFIQINLWCEHAFIIYLKMAWALHYLHRCECARIPRACLWECVCHCTYRVICGKLVYGLVCSDADLGLRAKLCTDSPWQLTYRDCGLYSTYWLTAYRTYWRGSSQADLFKLFIKYILHTGFKLTQVFWKQVCEVNQ